MVSISVPKIFLPFIVLLLLSVALKAQNDNNPLLFSNQAILMGDQRQVNDPVTMNLPGMALASGLGTFLDNPASVALFEESFLEFGIVQRNVDENTRFLGNTHNLKAEQTTVSNGGFISKAPVESGTVVVGAGFTQQSFFNRALSVSGRNPNTTITDQLKIAGNLFEDVAFNTFAIDYGDEEKSFLESIFRIGNQEFPGIRQEADIITKGYTGEFAGFLSVEFQNNLFLGLSLGVASGSFRFERTFLEIDDLNEFDDSIIDSDGDDIPDTNIERILLSDRFRSDMKGFRGRVGVLYKLFPWLNFGGSYTFRSSLKIDERINGSVRTVTDNGIEFEDTVFNEFTYGVSFPARIGAGVAIDNLGNFITVSAAADYVKFSNTRINFRNDILFEKQREENRKIAEIFDDVWSYRGGAALQFHPAFTLRGGYGYQPSRFKNDRDNREMFSAGIGIGISKEVHLDIGAQLTRFDETSTVFDFQDPEGNIRSEIADRDVEQIQVIGTLRIRI